MLRRKLQQKSYNKWKTFPLFLVFDWLDQENTRVMHTLCTICIVDLESCAPDIMHIDIVIYMDMDTDMDVYMHMYIDVDIDMDMDKI